MTTLPKPFLWIDTNPHYNLFVNEMPEVKIDLQLHDEIHRQIFERINLDFNPKQFLENSHQILTYEYFVNADIYREKLDTTQRFAYQTAVFAVGIYANLFDLKLISCDYEGKTSFPYILESIRNNMLLLRPV